MSSASIDSEPGVRLQTSAFVRAFFGRPSVGDVWEPMSGSDCVRELAGGCRYWCFSRAVFPKLPSVGGAETWLGLARHVLGACHRALPASLIQKTINPFVAILRLRTVSRHSCSLFQIHCTTSCSPHLVSRCPARSLSARRQTQPTILAKLHTASDARPHSDSAFSTGAGHLREGGVTLRLALCLDEAPCLASCSAVRSSQSCSSRQALKLGWEGSLPLSLHCEGNLL